MIRSSLFSLCEQFRVLWSFIKMVLYLTSEACLFKLITSASMQCQDSALCVTLVIGTFSFVQPPCIDLSAVNLGALWASSCFPCKKLQSKRSASTHWMRADIFHLSPQLANPRNVSTLHVQELNVTLCILGQDIPQPFQKERLCSAPPLKNTTFHRKRKKTPQSPPYPLYSTIM